jgi:hypothetical protein
METLINFFTLRPTFTFAGLKFVWYLYLLHIVVQAYVSMSSISQLLAQKGGSLTMSWPNLLPLFLTWIAQLVVVRLLIEVAAIIISQSQTPRHQ